MNGGWRWTVAGPGSLVAGLLSLTLFCAHTGARAAVAHASGCGGSSGGSFFTYGGSGRIVSELDVPVCATGRVTVTFGGDPAAGCARQGLCDYSGTETFDAAGNGDLTLLTQVRRGRRFTAGTLFLGGGEAPVRTEVQRTVVGGTGTQTTSCSDGAGDGALPAGAFYALQVAHEHVRIDLAGVQGALFGSRCAGPLDADFASAMPSRLVPLRALERGRTTIDLAGAGSFAAHGLSGTVTSTITLRLGRPRPERRAQVPRRRRQVHLAHTATADYRITRLRGSAVSTVQSAAAPAVCGPFDACGLSGTITVSPGPTAHGSVFLSALNGRAALPVLRAELRGGGPTGARLSGGGAASVRGAVAASMMQDGASCLDSVTVHALLIRLTRDGPRLSVSLAPSESQAADPLRTRCPGPDIGPRALARAVVPARLLARRSLSLTLRGTRFSDGPYRVSTRSSFALTLRRTATRVRVIHVVEISGSGSSAVLGDRQPPRVLDSAP